MILSVLKEQLPQESPTPNPQAICDNLDDESWLRNSVTNVKGIVVQLVFPKSLNE